VVLAGFTTTAFAQYHSTSKAKIRMSKRKKKAVTKDSTNKSRTEPWTKSQLMAPKLLANKISSHQTKDMLILCVGPMALIKGSVDIGPAEKPANLQKLKNYLKDVKKDKEIVIYCGCCPFDKCPNIRPAFKVLKKMGFKNAKLLNLSHNIKVDWLDKGYPTND
jgi:hypothetical protein